MLMDDALLVLRTRITEKDIEGLAPDIKEAILTIRSDSHHEQSWQEGYKCGYAQGTADGFEDGQTDVINAIQELLQTDRTDSEVVTEIINKFDLNEQKGMIQ